MRFKKGDRVRVNGNDAYKGVIVSHAPVLYDSQENGNAESPEIGPTLGWVIRPAGKSWWGWTKKPEFELRNIVVNEEKLEIIP